MFEGQLSELGLHHGMLAPPVHVLDIDPEYIASLTNHLQTCSYPTFVYASGSKFLAKVDEGTPGVLILELKLADMSGFDVLERLAQRTISPPAIVLTSHADVRGVVRAFQTGRITAFLQKQTVHESELLAAVRAAQARAARERVAYDECQEIRRSLDRLGAAELDVLRLLVQGQSTKRIADTLGVCPRTVEIRRTQILRVFGLDDYAELLDLVLKMGGVDSRSSVPL